METKALGLQHRPRPTPARRRFPSLAPSLCAAKRSSESASRASAAAMIVTVSPMNRGEYGTRVLVRRHAETIFVGGPDEKFGWRGPHRQHSRSPAHRRSHIELPRLFPMIGEGAQSSNQRRHSTSSRIASKSGSSPTRVSALAARPARSPARNGTKYRMTDLRGGNSYDNTGHLGASTWRHVLFVEQDRAKGNQIVGSLNRQSAIGNQQSDDPFRWIFLSDVCKHCEKAGCLEACPTGSIVRTEVGSVLVQDDVCNGCGYCVVSCPFGVIDRRPAPLPGAGGAVRVHVLLRPAKKRPHFRLRQSLPDRIDRLRTARRSPGARQRGECGCCGKTATKMRSSTIRRKPRFADCTLSFSSSANQKPTVCPRGRRCRQSISSLRGSPH